MSREGVCFWCLLVKIGSVGDEGGDGFALYASKQRGPRLDPRFGGPTIPSSGGRLKGPTPAPGHVLALGDIITTRLGLFSNTQPSPCLGRYLEMGDPRRSSHEGTRASRNQAADNLITLCVCLAPIFALYSHVSLRLQPDQRG